MNLKVLSYNIHKGFSSRNKEFVLDKIKESIEKSPADIVFLQEVVGSEGAGKYTSQFEFLADTVWSHHSYGKNSASSTGHHGNAILSKFPFIFSTNVDLSVNEIEERGMIHGIVRIPETNMKIHLLCTHLSLFQTQRKIQIEKIGQYINTHIPEDVPLILAGDFNDWQENITPHMLIKHSLFEAFSVSSGRTAKSFPSWFPFLRLDRIYYRNINLVSVDLHRDHPWNALSDHLALSSEFSTQD